MALRLARLAVVPFWAISVATVASEVTHPRPDELNRRVGLESESGDSVRRRAFSTGERADGRAEERIVVREGILFQTEGCPQLISEEEASARANDDSIPGNIINLASEGDGRAGNHFLVLSAYFAMAYCCKAKVLKMPRYDETIPSAVSGDGGQFETDKRFFDFSGVETMPLEEYEGLSRNPLACEPNFELSGLDAFHLWSVHPDLLSCMNRVYVRGCEAAYLEPLLGAESFGYCPDPAANSGRRLSKNDGQPRGDMLTAIATTSLVTKDVGTGASEAKSPEVTSSRAAEADPSSDTLNVDRVRDSRVRDNDTEEVRGSESSRNGVMPRNVRAPGVDEGAADGRRRLRAGGEWDGELLADGGRKPGSTYATVDDDGDDMHTSMYGVRKRGSAGSLVIHIRSGDIFRPVKPGRTPSRSFLSYGQPPLTFYLRAIASQPWSDVTILTFSLTPEKVNPAFTALEMMQQTGMLGPNVVTHKDRDLLTDLRSMLCADGLAVARSTLHFLTFAHTRAKHLFIPSECGPGTYARGHRDAHGTRKKLNPNNTTLLCIENPETEVYGVDWEVDEAAYELYDNWDASAGQRLDMLLYDGVKGLSPCCAA
ncbi:unnamed protein product [Scytosiphon promiscuus]